MKLRIRGNSIRLRLTRSEVAQFADAGVVEETLDFGPGKPQFKYSLVSSNDAPELSAEFGGGVIRVTVPSDRVRAWADSERVGIESANGLRLLIEKDFACMSERDGEDEADAYPNPNAEAP